MSNPGDEAKISPVSVMLAACGLAATADEERALREIHAALRPGIEALYAVPEARYEVPAPVFRAEPELAPWGER